MDYESFLDQLLTNIKNNTNPIEENIPEDFIPLIQSGISKLRTDGYLRSQQNKISGEGEFFLHLGGYAHDKKIAESDKLRIERQTLTIQRNLLKATVFLAIGSILLLIWEIVKMLCLS